MATDRLINKDQGDDIIDALSDIATNINTITYGPQTSADKVVAMTGYAKAGTAAAISQGDTLNEAVGKLEKKVDDNATAIAGKTAGPESATVGDIATFNNVNGKVLNDSGISIQTSVDTTKDTEVPTSKAVDTYVTGKGYAVGVTNSTANHIATFNGTDGKVLKDGGATIAFNTTGVLDDDTAIPTSKAVQSYVTGKHYAGSSSDGGAATSADKLNIGSSNIGSATQPVYFDKTTGKPVAITNTIQSNVPANAVFTDTTYTVATGTQNGKIKVTPSSGSAYEVPVYGLGDAAYKGVADTVSSSTNLVTSAAVNTKLASYVPNSDLIGIVDNGAKNLVNCYNLDAIKAKNTAGTWSGNIYTTGNTIFTIYSDGTIGVKTNGQTTQTTLNLPVPTLEADSYVLSGCPEGGTEAQTNGYLLDYQFVRNSSTVYIIDTGDGREFTYKSTDSNQQLIVMVRNQTTISTEILYKPMICTKVQFSISSAYEPYALGNQYLTPELIELCDSGAKNLLDLSKCTFTGLSNSYTVSGNTITIISYTTSSGIAELSLTTSQLPTNTNIVLTGCPSGGGDTTYLVDAYDNGTYINGSTDTGSGSSVFKFTTTTQKIRIRLAANYTITNKSFNLMICTKAAFGVSSKFVPYRPNYDLVANSVWKYSELRYTNTATNEFQNTGVSFTVPANRAVEFYAYDRKDAAYLDSIVVCDSETNLSTRTTTIISINRIESNGFTDSQYWTLQTTGIIPTYNAAVTYYVWVKRRSTGSNPVGLAYRFIS